VIDRPPSHDQTIEAIARCGVPASKIQIIYEEEIQTDTVSIDELSEAPSEARMTCIYRATMPFGYHVRFANADQDGLFRNWAGAEARGWARLEGRKWLQDRGLLDGVPTYSPDESDLSTFLSEVESYCSVERGSALEVVNDGFITLQAGFMQSIHGVPGPSETFTCLTNVLAASNLAEAGIRFGFIAHGAISEEGDSH